LKTKRKKGLCSIPDNTSSRLLYAITPPVFYDYGKIGFPLVPKEEQNWKDPPQLPVVLAEIERRIREAVVGDELKPGMVDTLPKTLTTLAEKGSAGLKNALEVISDLLSELTGVKSFKLTPKLPLSVEVEIVCAKEVNLELRKSVAPLTELESVIVGKRIHFEALLDQQQNGLRVNINEGFVLKFVSVLGRQAIAVKGSAILKRGKQGLMLVVSTPVPGSDQKVEVSIPLKHIIKHASKLV